jgi:type II secretory pathway pseudopilin PulG
VRGYTLIEALLLVVILGIVGASLGNSLIAASQSTEANDNTLLIDNALVTQMETLRATWQSDPLGVQTTQLTIGSQTYTMTTDIEKADPNGQGIQSTFFSLTIQIAGRTMCSYVGQ